MNPPQVYMCSPSWTLLPPPSPYHPSGSSQCTSPKHPVSCIEPGLATHFIHDILHVSMPFSQILPPSPSPTESIRLFYTSVSLLLSRTQGYCYHLSKFHIYVLVYCILLLKVHFSKWVSIKYAVIKSSFIKRTFWSNPRMLITQRIPETGCSYNKSITKGLATGASGKEPVCQCRRHQRCRFNPWVGKISGGRHGNPLQYSCLENSMDRGVWRATVHRVTKSQTQLKWPSVYAV